MIPVSGAGAEAQVPSGRTQCGDKSRYDRRRFKQESF